MQRSHALLALMYGLASGSTFAHLNLVGPEVKEGGLPQSCILQILNDAGSPTGVCSGTLSGKLEITTDAHCIVDESGKPVGASYTVACGYLQATVDADGRGVGQMTDVQTVSASNSTVHPKYLQLSGHTNDQYDLAHLRLDREMSGIEPATAWDAEELEVAARSPLQCRIEGYGIAANGRSGVLHHGPLALDGIIGNQLIGSKIMIGGPAPESIEPVLGAFAAIRQVGKDYGSSGVSKAIVAIKDRLPMTVMLAGDSGGGIFCRRTDQDGWHLIATNEAFAPILMSGQDESSVREIRVTTADALARTMVAARHVAIGIKQYASLIPKDFK